jgi:hypothetical protein
MWLLLKSIILEGGVIKKFDSVKEREALMPPRAIFFSITNCTTHYGLEAPKKREKSNPFEVLFF